MFVHLQFMNLVPIIHNSHNLTDINHLHFSLHITRQMRANILDCPQMAVLTSLDSVQVPFSGHSLTIPLVATSEIPHNDHLTLIC